MTATEPIQGGPYPEPSDPPDGPNQMAALATWAAGRLVMRFASTTARDAAITSPVEGMVCQTGTGASLTEWTYRSGSWQNTTVPGAWTAYTPTLSGTFQLGNGIVTARHCQIGKLGQAYARITLGSTSVMGSLNVGLPWTEYLPTPGRVIFLDAGTAYVPGMLLTGASKMQILTASGAALSPTVPFAWSPGDVIYARADAEVA